MTATTAPATTAPGNRAANVDTAAFAAFEWMLARRYLRARRKEGFISVIAGFSFVGIMLGRAMGVDLVHVPYKGGAPAMVDLLAGNIQLIFATVSTAITHVKTGKVRPLGMTSAKRSDYFPDIATIAESGLPGFALDNWSGIVGPAVPTVLPPGTPDRPEAARSRPVNSRMGSRCLHSATSSFLR